MPPFTGFPEGKSRPVPVPQEFFTSLLPEITELDDLKIILFSFWLFEKQEGAFRFVSADDFKANQDLMNSLDLKTEIAFQKLTASLQRLTAQGIFLEGKPKSGNSIFFLNSASGKAAIKGLQKGTWEPSDSSHPTLSAAVARPNIFRLYEENIGALTPLIAEDLKLAEQEYPQLWLEEAFHLAVQRNARSWRYIETILKRWKEQGRNDADQGRDPENRRKYITGQYGDIIKH